MKALVFTGSLPNYAVTLAFGRLHRGAYWGPLSCLRLADVPEPVPPGPDWAVVRTRLAGICGSDLHLIQLQTSPAVSAFTSFPFVIGHEGVGELAEGIGGLTAGQRVVVDPVLACDVRGIDPPCPQCAKGAYARCENLGGTGGSETPALGVSAGILLGGCRDLGGFWAPLFLAHKSQVFPVPEGVSDEAAALAEPVAVAVHAAARSSAVGEGAVGPADPILVIGGGVIGLSVMASLRHLGTRGRVLALVRHGHQARLAKAFGADDIILAGADDRATDAALARILGTSLRRPLIGRSVPTSGASLVFECAGSRTALDTALRFAAPGGEVVLAGLAATPKGIDWSHIWRKELRIRGTFCYDWEEVAGRGRRRTFAIALDLLASGRFDFGGLVTHRFRLEDYRQALATLLHKRSSGAVKAVFAFDRAR